MSQYLDSITLDSGLVTALTFAACTSTDVTTALGYTPLANITGLVSQGTNVTITGSGTAASPYVIAATASGSGTVTNVSGTSGEITSTGGTTPVLALATAGTAGTYGQVTTDTFGRVTAGAICTVANGGTGESSLTAYAVLCGGTTGTAAVQSVSGVGISGQVLTSNGGSALPTWQSASGGTSLPSGVLMPYGGTSSPPTGWLNCDGSAVSRTTYASLFSAIGTTYGAGDGSTTFNLPNMQGRTAVGTGTGGFTVTAGYSTANNWFTVSANTDELITGQSVQLNCTGTVKSGYTNGGNYYVYRVSSTAVYLCGSLQNALSQSPPNAGTGSFTGTITLTGSFSTRSLGQAGGEERHIVTLAEIPSPVGGVAVSGTIPVDTVDGSIPESGGQWDGISVLGGQDGGDSSVTLESLGQLVYGTGPGFHNNMQPYLGLTWIIKI